MSPATVGELSVWAAGRYGDAVAQRFRRDDRLHEVSFTQLDAQVRALAAGLAGLGIGAGDRVALLCQTRPEWTVCDLAVSASGAITVPIYPTNSAREIAWVLRDSGARAVIAETSGHLDIIESVRAQLPGLEHIIAIDDDDRPGAAHDSVLTLDELGRPVVDALEAQPPAASSAEPAGDATSTIMYTSGTTGNAKGCQLSHANLRAVITIFREFAPLGPDDVFYLYLPLAHLLTRMAQLVAFESGAALAYTAGDITAVPAELRELRPTVLPSVPRLFEKVHQLVSDAVAGLPEAERDPGQVHELVRAAFGGRLRYAITGGAPIAPQILEFFFAGGMPVYEAYGMTESTAVISANRPGATRIGTVGAPVPGVEVRIADDGEICARSAGVFTGYWHNPEATAELVQDGWLHTGDLGRLDADGYLVITGRKKDIIITSGGKNLTPANLENDLRRSRYIANAVMCGDRRPYPVALITLDAEEISAWARQHDLPGDPTELSLRPEVRALVAAAVGTANADYAPVERIRTFAILPEDFTIESGELTATLKVRRAVVAEHYADILDQLYTTRGEPVAAPA